MSLYRSVIVCRLACVCVACLMATTASASNFSFLKSAALAKFNDDDMRLLSAAANAALSDSTTSSLRTWKNDATGHHGELRVTAAFVGANGEQCKRLQVTNYAAKREDKATYSLCNMPPDGWRLVPSDYARSKTER